jgi:flavin reductase (NADH)
MSIVDEFKGALSCWASGVSVVTAEQDGLLYGLTVSSFSSLSLDPPLVLVCINNNNRLVEMAQTAGTFSVSILGSEQQAASNQFARPGREPTPDFGEIGVERVGGQAVVAGSHAALACALHDSLVQGDHTILVGRVEGVKTRPVEPLLYYNRGYRTVS